HVDFSAGAAPQNARLLTLPVLLLLAAFLYAILFGIPVILLFQAVPPVAVLLVLVGVLAWMVTALLIRVPFSTYLYYYYLHMYEDLVG
ncbi:MAG: hypothetical protein ABEI07_01585, partial [Candidatus Nanohaloarchaea archaeon]